jgi:hypothetical protein
MTVYQQHWFDSNLGFGLDGQWPPITYEDCTQVPTYPTQPKTEGQEDLWPKLQTATLTSLLRNPNCSLLNPTPPSPDGVVLGGTRGLLILWGSPLQVRFLSSSFWVNLFTATSYLNNNIFSVQVRSGSIPSPGINDVGVKSFVTARNGYLEIVQHPRPRLRKELTLLKLVSQVRLLPRASPLRTPYSNEGRLRSSSPLNRIQDAVDRVRFP